jgi:hypothetical protein
MFGHVKKKPKLLYLTDELANPWALQQKRTNFSLLSVVDWFGSPLIIWRILIINLKHDSQVVKFLQLYVIETSAGNSSRASELILTDLFFYEKTKNFSDIRLLISNDFLSYRKDSGCLNTLFRPSDLWFESFFGSKS